VSATSTSSIRSSSSEHHARASNDAGQRSLAMWTASESPPRCAGRGPTSGLPTGENYALVHDVGHEFSGVSSIVSLTVSTIKAIDGSRPRVSARLQPRRYGAGPSAVAATQSDSLSVHSPGLADPMAILMSSAVRREEEVVLARA